MTLSYIKKNSYFFIRLFLIAGGLFCSFSQSEAYSEYQGRIDDSSDYFYVDYDDEELMEDNTELKGSGRFNNVKKAVIDYGKVVKKIGNVHIFFLHFPIILIFMTGISELFSAFSNSLIFTYSAKFTVIVAALISLPTALLGLVYSYGITYEHPLADAYWWHRFLGLFIAFLTIITALLSWFSLRRFLYKLSLFSLVVLSVVAGYLGSEYLR
jgi:hypothetical protein